MNSEIGMKVGSQLQRILDKLGKFLETINLNFTSIKNKKNSFVRHPKRFT